MTEDEKAYETKWFEASQNLIPTTLAFVESRLDLNELQIEHIHQAKIAFDFMRHGLAYLEEANRRGHHAISLSLLRQTVDPLFLVQCGLLGTDVAQNALRDWQDSKTTMGKLRKRYGASVWGCTKQTFMNMSWSEFMASMFGAVQEYAHYGQNTLQWSMSQYGQSSVADDGNYLVPMKMWSYDSEQATRITMFQAIIVSTLTQTLLTSSNIHGWQVSGVDSTLSTFREGLDQSKLIIHPFNWETELLGMSFVAPGSGG